MTANARPPSAPLPASLAAYAAPFVGQVRLFPLRLGPARPRAHASAMPGGDAGRVWLLSRLWTQHARLECRIAEEAARPRPDADTLRALKREKLAVRDRIALLERRP